MPLFADILGQTLALTSLRQALAHGASHAYLFAGPAGVGKSDTALAFAAGLACPDRGCGACETCRRVLEGLHPDVEIVSPEGAFITIDQIREINREVVMRPFEASVRVYVLLDAHTLKNEAANALLKTLEEPPPHAHFILVTDSPQALPQTVVSRCRRVLFTSVASPVLAAHLVAAYGLSEVEALAFARVAHGSPVHARALATDPGARSQRERLLGWARSVGEAGAFDAHVMLTEIMDSVERRADERVKLLEDDTAARLQWAPDARTRARIEKLHEDRVKRGRRRAVTEGLDEVTATFATWHRDLAAVAVGAEEAVFNYDFLFELRDRAFPGLVDQYMEVVEAVKRTRERFRYNVDARCALEEMIFSIREALQ
ncbi:MAG TPA: DNA polymerase III subunit delta' [Thermoleophilia bacterium]|nr:DNA polymerase III subunit delta' [Thermoleophilia bacterium]